MIVTIRGIDLDRRICHARVAHGAMSVLTYASDCESALIRSIRDDAAVDIDVHAGEIVRADIVIGGAS